MYRIWKILIEITVWVTIIVSGEDEASRSKIAHVENFNVLLNLYKMNPLKKSQVYKSFLNGILLPNRGNSALNINSNESVFDKTKPTLSVKQLANIINASNSNNNIKQPDFDVENIDAEKFSINNIKNQIVKESPNRKEYFNSILGHLESVEDDHIPVTKMLPVNNTNSVALLNTNEIDFDLPGDTYRNVDKVFSYVNATVTAIQNSNVINDVHERRNDLNVDSVVVFKK